VALCEKPQRQFQRELLVQLRGDHGLFRWGRDGVARLKVHGILLYEIVHTGVLLVGKTCILKT
jgi:hypothetical protein